MKIILLLMSLVFIVGASSCNPGDKYQAQPQEDCALLTKWVPESKMDWVTCYCVDKNIKDDATFTTILLNRVKANMSNHPLAQQAINYVTENEKAIIANQQYELPAQYCRGYSMTNPQARSELQSWSEDNRLQRIKCEQQIPNQLMFR